MSDSKTVTLTTALTATIGKLEGFTPLGNKAVTVADLRADMFAAADIVERGYGTLRNVAAALFMVWHAERVASGPAGEMPTMANLIVGPHDTTLTKVGQSMLSSFSDAMLPAATDGDAVSTARQRARRAMLQAGIVDACVWQSLGVTLADYVPDARTFALPLSAFVPYGHYPVSVVEAAHSRAAKVIIPKAADKLNNKVLVGVGLVVKLEREEDAPEALKTVAFVAVDAKAITNNRAVLRAMAAVPDTSSKMEIANKGAAGLGKKKPGAQASSPAAASEEAHASLGTTPDTSNKPARTSRAPRTPNAATANAQPMIARTLPAMLPEVIGLLEAINSSEEGIRALMGDASTFDRVQVLERICRDLRTKAVAMAKAADRAKAKPMPAKLDAADAAAA